MAFLSPFFKRKKSPVFAGSPPPGWLGSGQQVMATATTFQGMSSAFYLGNNPPIPLAQREVVFKSTTDVSVKELLTNVLRSKVNYNGQT